MSTKVDSAGAPRHAQTIKNAHERNALKAHSSRSKASQFEALCRPSDIHLTTIERRPAGAGASGFDWEMTAAYQNATRLPSPLRERVLEELNRSVTLMYDEFWSPLRRPIKPIRPIRRARCRSHSSGGSPR